VDKVRETGGVGLSCGEAVPTPTGDGRRTAPNKGGRGR
jgi:hypothetical protein